MLIYLFILVPIFKFLPVQPAIVISILFIAILTWKRNFRLLRNGTLFIFLVFFLWGTFTSLFAQYSDAAIKTQGKVLVVMFFMFILYLLAYKHLRYIYELYGAYILMLFLLIFFSMASGEFSPFGVQKKSYRDLSRDEWLLDPNTFGYYVFFALVFAFILYTVKRKGIINYGKLVALIPISYSLILFTASRGSYVIFSICLFLCCLVFLMQYKLKRGKWLWIYFGIIGIVIPTGSFVASMLIKGTALEERFNQSEKHNVIDPRILHIFSAIEVGKNNPVMGVGGGNYARQPRPFERGSFSHCSFTEAFANYGYPGLIILLMLYGEFGRKLYAAFYSKALDDKREVVYLMVFFIGFLLYNFFYVSYLSVEFMGAYLAASLHLDHLLKI